MEGLLRDNVALYAAVKTFHSDGHDMWAAVEAMTLLIMPERCTDEEVKTNFNQQYQLEVPFDVLKTILSRLRKDGYTTQDNPLNTLTNKGRLYQQKLESSLKDIRREFRALVIDFEKYLKEKNVKIAGSTEVALLDFIDDNIGFASDVMTTSTTKRTPVAPASTIANYIVNIERSQPKLFEILQNVFFGRLYLTLIKTRAELDTNAKFDKLLVLLDTNIIMSLLGLHEDTIGKSAHELLGVFAEFKGGIEVAVLDETLHEATTLLDAYSREDSSFVENLQVDSAAYRMRIRHMDKGDLTLLAEQLPDMLQEFGITIKGTPVVEVPVLNDIRAGLRGTVLQSGSQKNPAALEHDAILLASVKILRGKSNFTKLLEKSKAVFVSPDHDVHKYSMELMAKNETRFPLSIRPVDIISLLWVKAIGLPNSKFSGAMLRQAVMGYARERLISQNLWDQFVTKLKEAEGKGKITAEGIGMILAADETEKLLLTNKPEVIPQILNPKYVQEIRDKYNQLEESEKAKRRKINELSRVISRKSQSYEALEDEVKKTTGKNKVLATQVKKTVIKISNLEGRFRGFAKGLAFAVVLIFSLAVAVGFVWLVVWTLSIFEIGQIANYIAVGVFVLIGVVALALGKEVTPVKWIIRLRAVTQKRIENAIFRRIMNFLTNSEDK